VGCLGVLGICLVLKSSSFFKHLKSSSISIHFITSQINLIRKKVYKMVKSYKKLLVNVLSIFLFASLPLMLMAGEVELKTANKLLDVMQFETVVNDSINASIQMMKQMDPKMGKHEAVVKKFFDKFMGVESLRQDMVEMYSEIFTADELEDIISFYMTETGQKALKNIPEVMQRSMQLAQKRVGQNIGELQKMLEEELATE
jgi:uncharacterized protein